MVKPKKSYGQHFLINEGLAEGIVQRALGEAGEYEILELGPGKAALTKYLIKSGATFKTVEADREVVQYLHDHYPELTPKILEFDFLKLDFSKVFDGRPFFLLGNFPYNISSQILIKVIKHVEYIPAMLGMFQLEVAERIVSVHGKKSYGTLSIFTQAFYDAKIVFRVSPGSFSPPPKVKSAVILLTRKRTSLDCNYSLLRTLVRSGFNQRRKMMRNSLSSVIQNKEILKNDRFKNRPEQLSVKEFIELTNWIEKHSS